MAEITLVNIGATADDGTGDTLRDAFNKLNDNDTAINLELSSKAASSHTHTLADISDAGTAAASNAGDFATASHTHTLADVTDAGAMAAKDTVENADIVDGEITKGKFSASCFEDNAGIETGTATDEIIHAAALKHASGIYRYTDGTAAGGNITEITAAHAGQSIDFDQDLTLDNAFGADRASGVGIWVELVNVDTSSHTLTVEAGAGGTGTIDDAGSITIPAGGSVIVSSLSNAGDEPVCRSAGDTTEIDFGGRPVYGNSVKVQTVSGVLTLAAHSGKALKTSGNITIPTTEAEDGGFFNGTIIAGGAHTVTFNSTTSAPMATGDIMSIVVESATVIHAVLTASADKVAFS